MSVLNNRRITVLNHEESKNLHSMLLTPSNETKQDSDIISMKSKTETGHISGSSKFITTRDANAASESTKSKQKTNKSRLRLLNATASSDSGAGSSSSSSSNNINTFSSREVKQETFFTNREYENKLEEESLQDELLNTNDDPEYLIDRIQFYKELLRKEQQLRTSELQNNQSSYLKLKRMHLFNESHLEELSERNVLLENELELTHQALDNEKKKRKKLQSDINKMKKLLLQSTSVIKYFEAIDFNEHKNIHKSIQAQTQNDNHSLWLSSTDRQLYPIQECYEMVDENDSMVNDEIETTEKIVETDDVVEKSCENDIDETIKTNSNNKSNEINDETIASNITLTKITNTDLSASNAPTNVLSNNSNSTIDPVVDKIHVKVLYNKTKNYVIYEIKVNLPISDEVQIVRTRYRNFHKIYDWFNHYAENNLLSVPKHYPNLSIFKKVFHTRQSYSIIIERRHWLCYVLNDVYVQQPLLVVPLLDFIRLSNR